MLLSVIFVLLHFNRSRSCPVSRMSQGTLRNAEWNRTGSRGESAMKQLIARRERERRREHGRERRKKRRIGVLPQTRGDRVPREIIISSGFARFPGVFHFFGNFRFFLRARELLDPPHRKPANSSTSRFSNRRMRRESLAQVTALLKTMKQTLYERGYGANYLAISRASNK